MVAKLDAEAREAALAGLPGWDYDAERDGLRRRFTFADFVAAFGFMTRVALLADIVNFDPHQFSAVNMPIMKNCYDSLIEYTPEGKAIPNLASAWQVAADSKSVTLTLRGDVRFHAGGTLAVRDLAPGETLRIDTGCVAAFQPSVDFDIQYVGKLKSALFSGEGLSCAFLGMAGGVFCCACCWVLRRNCSACSALRTTSACSPMWARAIV